MLDHMLLANGIGREAGAEGDCGAVCHSLGIRWDSSPWRESAASNVRKLAETGDLLIFGHAFHPNQHQDLLNKQVLLDFPAVLVCPDEYSPISRILVLNKQVDGDQGFLTRAAHLCNSLKAFPIVLTVARSVREAQAAQRAAQKTLLEQRVGADFDCIVGSEVRLLIAKVARWRRCQLIMMERRISKPWWRWMRAPHNEWLIELNQSFALLAFPGVGFRDSVATEKPGQNRLETSCNTALSPQRNGPQFQEAILQRSPENGGPND